MLEKDKKQTSKSDLDAFSMGEVAKKPQYLVIGVRPTTLLILSLYAQKRNPEDFDWI